MGEGEEKENKKLDVAGCLFWIPAIPFNRNGREARMSQLERLRVGPVSPGEQNVSDNKVGDLLQRDNVCCFALPSVSKALQFDRRMWAPVSSGLPRSLLVALRLNVYWL